MSEKKQYFKTKMTKVITTKKTIDFLIIFVASVTKRIFVLKKYTAN